MTKTKVRRPHKAAPKPSLFGCHFTSIHILYIYIYLACDNFQEMRYSTYLVLRDWQPALVPLEPGWEDAHEGRTVIGVSIELTHRSWGCSSWISGSLDLITRICYPM